MEGEAAQRSGLPHKITESQHHRTLRLLGTSGGHLVLSRDTQSGLPSTTSSQLLKTSRRSPTSQSPLCLLTVAGAWPQHSPVTPSSTKSSHFQAAKRMQEELGSNQAVLGERSLTNTALSCCSFQPALLAYQDLRGVSECRAARNVPFDFVQRGCPVSSAGWCRYISSAMPKLGRIFEMCVIIDARQTLHLVWYK